MTEQTRSLVVAGALVGLVLSVVSLSTGPPTGFGGAIAVGVVVFTLFALTLARRPVWLPVVALAITVRLPFATFLPIHDDSGFYFAAASRLAAGDLAFSPHLGVEGIMAVFILLFGESGANIASFTASIGSVVLVGLISEELFDSRTAGLASAFVFAILPLHVNFSSWAYTEPIALFFFSVAMYFLIREQYVFGLALTGAVLFMRIEYALLILLPYATLRLVDRSAIRYVPLVTGFVPPTAILVARYVLGLSPERLADILSTLPTPMFSTTFLQTFIKNPFAILTENILFYAPHFLYWGVPYWEVVLLNPLLPLLAVYGLYRIISRVRYVTLIFIATIGLVVVSFFYREVIAGGYETFSIPFVLAFGALTIVILMAGARSRNKMLEPLLATLPYHGILAYLYLAPRYMLPLGVIYSLYAGYGLAQAYQILVVPDEWVVELRRPI